MLPRLVIVSGMPGAGKTTLARIIASELGLPLLTKDDVKEAIAEAIPADDREASRQLGRAAYQVLRLTANRLLDAGVGVVLESNFARGISEQELRPLLPRSRAVLVQCEVPEPLAVARYRERARAGTRHAVHKDGAVLDAWTAGITSDHRALELGIEVVVVDTSDGYRPPIPELIAALR